MASERYSNEIDSWLLSQKNDLNAIQEDVEINSAYYSDDALLSRMLNYKLKKHRTRFWITISASAIRGSCPVLDGSLMQIMTARNAIGISKRLTRVTLFLQRLM